jgi:hypothetical protein
MKCVVGLMCVGVVCVGLSVLGQAQFFPKPVFLPDLVIQEVTYQESGTGDFHTYKFGVGIQNTGPGQANLWTKAAVYIITDVFAAQQPWLFGTVDVSPIAAGDGLMVFVSRQLSASVAPCCVVVLLDAPVVGKPLGQLNEGTNGEKNNGFIFFLSPALGLQTFENPAFAE